MEYGAEMADGARNLPQTLDAFIEQQVRSGAYRDRDAVIIEAVQRMKAQADSDQSKIDRLNLVLRAAAARLDRGEGEVVTDIDAYFDAIEAEATGR